MERIDRNELMSADQPAYSHPVDVRFQDIDAAGIVFFARFFEYVHAAYEELLKNVSSGLPDALREGRWAAPIRHAEADYRAPVRYGEEIEVQLVRARMLPTEVTLGWRVVRLDGKVCVLAQTVHTFVDPQSFQRISVPGAIAEALERIS